MTEKPQSIVSAEDIDAICEMVLQGKTWEKYDTSSLVRLETMIERHRKEGETPETIPATTFAWGIYLGEVIRRAIGPNCVWSVDGHEPTLEINGSQFSKLWPVRRVRRRLLDPADGVEMWARFAIHLGTGKLKVPELADEGPAPSADEAGAGRANN